MRELQIHVLPTALEADAEPTARPRPSVVAAVLLGLIGIYRRFVSPALPVVTLGACACRFSPSCSAYAADAVRTHGALAGGWLALCRLLKCTPLHAGGLDPVPPARRRCRTVTAESRPRVSSAAPNL